MSAPASRLTMATGVHDVGAQTEPFDFSGARDWSVLVLLEGKPAAVVECPSPGAAGAELSAAVLDLRAEALRARLRMAAELHRRLGTTPGPDPTLPVPRVSVVLSTHRRPQYLPAMLTGLERLDPAPDEVVVVDNAPGDQNCRALVEAAGLVYVREDRKGLDNARNTGIRATKGDVVVFTDDDCVPPPGWLRTVRERFMQPGVAGVTGPAFPYLLDTPSRVRMERQAGMNRGLHLRTFSFENISAVHAGAIGCGANMAFRRDVLLGLGPEPFPPELDAGTATESGGETFAIARVIAEGHRLVYDPEMFTFHQHRPDPRALQKAVRGYGIGISAAMAKLLVEEGEFESWKGWAWLLKQYLRTQRRRVVGRADAVETRLSVEYLIGGLMGVRRWRRALEVARADGALAPVRVTAPSPPPARDAGGGSGALLLSVVVPTFRRPEMLARCLDHLAAQDFARTDYEVLVVDDDPDGQVSEAAAARPGLHVRVLASAGGGASAARNTGARAARAPVVLFLDDDILAGPQLLRRHLERQDASGEAVTAVVGSSAPAPAERGLTALSAALWWRDFFDRMGRAARPSFTWLLTGNVSMPREAFLATGGFDQEILRREDWEFGLTWLHAGHAVAYEPAAAGRHEYTLTTVGRVRGTVLEGTGDAIMTARHPEIVGALPLAKHRPPDSGSALRRLALGAYGYDRTRDVVVVALHSLEALKLRRAWYRLMVAAQKAGYALGLHGVGDPTVPGAEPLLECDLLADTPLDFAGPVAPTLRVTVGGRDVGLVRPQHGLWGPHLVDDLLITVEHEELERAALARGWMAAAAPSRSHEHVLVAGGAGDEDGAAFWAAVADEAASTRLPLIAFALPGKVHDHRWLDEALVAFDGPEVAAVFGRGVLDDISLRPLVLADGPGSSSFGTAHNPSYVIIAADVLRAMGGVPVEAAGHGTLAPLVVLLARLRAAGLVLAERDVHGLSHEDTSAKEMGAAWAAARLATEPAAVGRLGVTVVATLAWDAVKRRGKPRGQLVKAARGAAGAALSVQRATLQSRRRGR